MHQQGEPLAHQLVIIGEQNGGIHVLMRCFRW
jgi:hypothetical protein